MRRWPVAALLVLVAVGFSRAQDEESPPEGDDANPSSLGKDELDAIKKLHDLENHAIEALRARDFEGSERRYKKLMKKLDEEETVNEPTRRRLESYAHYNLACTYSLAQRTEEAVAELRLSLDYGFWGWKHMKKDADLDNVREEEGYKKAIRYGKKLEAKACEEDEARLVAQVTSSIAGKPVIRRYELDVTGADGNEINLAELRGKVVVVDVFRPYSDDGDPPEIDALVKLHASYRRKGVDVIGLTPMSGGDLTQWLAKFVQENEVKYHLAGPRPSDPSLRPYNKSFGETRLLFLDKKGKVRGTARFLRSYETLETVVNMLLDAPDRKKE